MAAKKKQSKGTNEKNRIFRALGLKARLKGANCGGEWFAGSGDHLETFSPTTGESLARIEQASAADYAKVMKQAKKAFIAWRALPAPKRGEIVRQVGLALREKKDMLGIKFQSADKHYGVLVLPKAYGSPILSAC